VNEHELERYEAELRGAAPAPLPEHFMARLQAAKPATEPARRTPIQPAVGKPRWPGWLRWLAPVMALAVALAGWLVFQGNFTGGSSVKKQPLAAATGFKADNVQLDEELVSSFDVVALLPGGQPVRFRCRQWRDQLVVTDKNHGVEIQQSSPRVEVVPVRFETY
jgi:hypothetical protein